MFKKIAVAFDESAEADRAFQAALDLAKLTSAELYIVTVIENLPAYISYVSAVAPDVPGLLKSQRRTFYEDLHGRAKLMAEQSGIRFHGEIVEGDEIQAMLQLLNQIRPDLLVVADHHAARDTPEMQRPRDTLTVLSSPCGLWRLFTYPWSASPVR